MVASLPWITDRLRRAKTIWHDIRSIGAIRAELDLLRSRVDSDPGLFRALEAERRSDAYAARYSAAQPLVSICIATFNRGELVCERAIRSLLDQTYRNLEIIVVGDGCTDDTEARVANIRDSRLTFVNLAERGDYPSDPQRRWCVAGTAAVNKALDLASGDFITHLDDDDRHAPERVEKLVRFCQANRLEAAWHPFAVERADGSWATNPAETFAAGSVTTSSIFYDRFFKRIPWDIEAHLMGEPGDWNRLRKFAFLGARTGRHPDVLLEHFKERNQRAS